MIDRFLNKFLDQFTMYRLVLYYLVALLSLAVVLSSFGLLPVKPIAVLETTALLLVVTLVTNWAFSVLLRVPTNQESSVITALILALVLGPVSLDSDPLRFGIVAMGGAFAMASKYLLVWRRHHIFNPVALGIFLTGVVFGDGGAASWWVGQLVMLPAIILGGLILIRKTNRLRFMGAFFLIFTVFLSGWSLFQSLTQGLPADQIGQNLGFSFLLTFETEIPFFAFVMLTEPLTSPTRFGPQLVYLCVAAFFALPMLSLAGINFSPELALLTANLVSFVLGPRGRHSLVLKEQRALTPDTVGFAFAVPKGFKYRPGQYLELTLPLEKGDSRGNRRYLSFASSPTEDELLIVSRFPERTSAFKTKWRTMEPGQALWAAEVSGDFVLPKDPRVKLAFIAGGIGVTPFRSMVKSLVDTRDTRDLVVVDSHSLAEHRVFDDVLEEATQTIGAKVVSTITRPSPGWKGERGPVDAEFLTQHVPDLHDRTFFVSGSPSFVEHVKKALRSLKVRRWRIRTDFFPGY